MAFMLHRRPLWHYLGFPNSVKSLFQTPKKFSAFKLISFIKSLLFELIRQFKIVILHVIFFLFIVHLRIFWVWHNFYPCSFRTAVEIVLFYNLKPFLTTCSSVSYIESIKVYYLYTDGFFFDWQLVSLKLVTTALFIVASINVAFCFILEGITTLLIIPTKVILSAGHW